MSFGDELFAGCDLTWPRFLMNKCVCLLHLLLLVCTIVVGNLSQTSLFLSIKYISINLFLLLITYSKFVNNLN